MFRESSHSLRHTGKTRNFLKRSFRWLYGICHSSRYSFRSSKGTVFIHTSGFVQCVFCAFLYFFAFSPCSFLSLSHPLSQPLRTPFVAWLNGVPSLGIVSVSVKQISLLCPPTSTRVRTSVSFLLLLLLLLLCCRVGRLILDSMFLLLYASTRGFKLWFLPPQHTSSSSIYSVGEFTPPRVFSCSNILRITLHGTFHTK